MSTWQLFSDKDNNFHWTTSDQDKKCDIPAQPHTDTRRLPSMSDLLLLGCSKLVENEKVDVESAPMFRTGLGKSVVLKQSSVAKARSVLGDFDGGVNDTGRVDMRGSGSDLLKPRKEIVSMRPANTIERLPTASNNVFNMSNSMFQTGSGKTVNISSAGLLRAKTLLGLQENCDEEFLYGSTKTHQQSSIMHPARQNPQLASDVLPNLTFASSTKVLESSDVQSSSFRSDSKDVPAPAFMNTAAKPPPVKYQTAGGRSISVSNEAFQRARSLLGNPECDSFLNEASTMDFVLPVIDYEKVNCPSHQKVDFRTPYSGKEAENGDNSLTNFTSPLRISSFKKQSLVGFEKLQPGSNLITKFDAAVADNTDARGYNGITCSKSTLKSIPYTESTKSSVKGIQMRTDLLSNRVLVDISNSNNIERVNEKQYLGEKRRLGHNNSVSAFKKPRNSFVTPLSKNNSSINSLSRLASKEPCSKEKLSLRYPHQKRRTYLKEYILLPPSAQRQLKDLPKNVRSMNPRAAESYIFQNKRGAGIGPDDFHLMLSQAGTSTQHLTKQWVSNHYKWIVWKLACYERCYPDNFSGKLLTVHNVLEELKYRYELEVNHGHRSAIRKILDGDAMPSSMMVLCISSVHENNDSTCGPPSVLSEGDGNGKVTKIELTDGWYTVKALLDEQLSQKLASGKLFLGQKLRIWGAKLFGWGGPITPSEASQSAGLILNINGTYRCHWAERLGFSKAADFSLAFRCIKANGGIVPNTLVGIKRLYPVLYRERLTTGGFIVRPERMETNAQQLYDQRRTAVAEGIMSERGMGVDFDEPSECEGAKIRKLLETSAEPEVLMAGMSSKQLASFSAYKAKLEATRHSNMQKFIEKALEADGLTEREVTPFVRVKVVGLENKCRSTKCFSPMGIITIWNPTEKQKLELSEGQAYAVSGLQPSGSDSDILYLQARGSTTNWLPLSPLAMGNFEPFFSPRSSTTISNLGKIPLSSEFDVAALVIFAGEVYIEGQYQKQWVFVTDGSTEVLGLKESSDVLLAINFCFSYEQSTAPVKLNITGSVVGFCNLTKKPADKVNGIWLADAAENSDYFLSYDDASRKHLKDAAASVLKWSKTSSLMIKKLKDRVMSIVTNSKN